jgi:hypothetical protein
LRAQGSGAGAHPKRRLWRLDPALVFSGLCSLSLGTAPSCASTTSGNSPADPSSAVRRDTAMQHEACETDSSQAEKTDLNRDGRPDLLVVRAGTAERCRSMDLNFDGKVDLWVYRDGSGQVRRRETDFDKDGRVDEVAYFQAGVIKSKERAAAVPGKIDTWQFYKDGKLSTAERDATGDGLIDQWWEFPNPEHTECPVIHIDSDGDGRPDPSATIDMCPSEASTTSTASAPAAATAAPASTGSTEAGALPKSTAAEVVPAPPVASPTGTAPGAAPNRTGDK